VIDRSEAMRTSKASSDMNLGRDIRKQLGMLAEEEFCVKERRLMSKKEAEERTSQLTNEGDEIPASKRCDRGTMKSGARKRNASDSCRRKTVTYTDIAEKSTSTSDPSHATKSGYKCTSRTKKKRNATAFERLCPAWPGRIEGPESAMKD